ncbi:ROK family protein [Opitutus terrae]|uniref:ROK family protein n=1 Tax=Opitutus terrae (strain DSM 11246 / JCM 15787 / PB90-1) TaxID=452637 RepID=B1ZXC5_OPITP|nr:ROK family protein [Opitutus terrae]ACB76176.1 ROK family protein [Opitutus terrae PB90-1]
MTSSLIGIDLGGTKCAVSIPDGDDGVREVARFASDKPAPTLARLFAEIDRLQPGDDVVFGISCGGPLDAERGLILSPPNLPGWDRIAICDQLTRRYGGDARLMNDANACALAEWQFGAGRGTRNMIFLTMGTGMGAGLILDGRLYEGTNGNAGEVGHVRLVPTGPVGYGKPGSFEGFCSGGGIAQLAHRFWPEALPDQLTAREAATAATLGDPVALRLWHEVGIRLGEALAILVDVLNPERIVIGSIFARCEQFIAGGMQESLRREALAPSLAVCSVVPAALGEQIGSHAALAIARCHLRPVSTP